MKKIFLIAIFLASMQLFSQGLSVEISKDKIYTKIPTILKINHITIGDYDWKVLFSKDTIFTDTILNGHGQVVNQDFYWTPDFMSNNKTDRCQLQIVSQSGLSALSPPFLIYDGQPVLDSIKIAELNKFIIDSSKIELTYNCKDVTEVESEFKCNVKTISIVNNEIHTELPGTYLIYNLLGQLIYSVYDVGTVINVGGLNTGTYYLITKNGMNYKFYIFLKE